MRKKTCYKLYFLIKTAATVTGAAFEVQTKIKTTMNTQLKVGDRVRVISCYDTDCNGKEGFVAFINKPECYISVRFRHNDTIRKLYVDPLVGVELILQVIQDTPPTPKWLPIDRDNLYPDKVVAMDICGSENGIYFGTLELDRNNDIVLYLGNGQYLPRFTHYIPLQDLLNLPISE